MDEARKNKILSDIRLLASDMYSDRNIEQNCKEVISLCKELLSKEKK